MGLDYEYHLHFPQEQIWNVLESIAAIAKPEGETTIALPDREIVLPFRSSYENQTVVFDDSVRGLGFDTSLYFASDEEIEQYEAKYNIDDETKALRRDNKGRVAIGSIYLSVISDLRNSGYLRKWKPDICLFEFAASTTSMSLLFEKSTSIKRALKRLLKQHNGLCGFLHDTNYTYHPSQALWPPDISVREACLRFLVEPDAEATS